MQFDLTVLIATALTLKAKKYKGCQMRAAVNMQAPCTTHMHQYNTLMATTHPDDRLLADVAVGYFFLPKNLSQERS